MKLRTKHLFLAVSLFSATAAAAADPSGFSARNAEDLVASSNSRWVFASSMAGGGQAAGALAAIDLRTGAVRRLDPIRDAIASSGSETCTAPITVTAFKPHGMALHSIATGQEQLFVVNHGERESIEIYRVERGDPPELRWTGCVPLPSGLSGNSVTASADGAIYVTNMGKSLDGSHAEGDVVFWRSDSGWKTVPDSRIRGPNGILSSRDGKRLYVASWSSSEIVELTLDAHKSARRALPLGFLPDNLRWSTRGTILAAGQRTGPQAVADCYNSARTTCRIASAMAEIDPATFTILCTRSIPVNTATVALGMKKTLLVGTFRGERVIQLETGCGTSN